jgi:hypothetical protein
VLIEASTLLESHKISDRIFQKVVLYPTSALMESYARSARTSPITTDKGFHTHQTPSSISGDSESQSCARLDRVKY